MKLGIVIYSDHSETIWNACRLANFSLSKGDQVKVFLMEDLLYLLVLQIPLTTLLKKEKNYFYL